MNEGIGREEIAVEERHRPALVVTADRRQWNAVLDHPADEAQVAMAASAEGIGATRLLYYQVIEAVRAG